jgi:hypothetical protein
MSVVVARRHAVPRAHALTASETRGQGIRRGGKGMGVNDAEGGRVMANTGREGCLCQHWERGTPRGRERERASLSSLAFPPLPPSPPSLPRSLALHLFCTKNQFSHTRIHTIRAQSTQSSHNPHKIHKQSTRNLFLGAHPNALWADDRHAPNYALMRAQLGRCS